MRKPDPPPEEMIPLMIELSQDSDPNVAAVAAHSLASFEASVIVDWLKRHATEAGLKYFARHRTESSVLEAILRHWLTPPSVLEKLAPKLEPELQEILIDRHDAILKRPTILVALECNPKLLKFCKRRIWEFREHLLPKDAFPIDYERPATKPKPKHDHAAPRLAMFSWRELNLMSCDMRYRPEMRRSAERALLEQLPRLQGAERAAIARQGGAAVLGELLFDNRPVVVQAVLGNPRLRERPLLKMVSSDRASPAILELVANHARWRSRYAVRLELCRNPRTPFPAVASFLRGLQPRDMKKLVAANSAASPAVRKRVAQLRMGS